MTHNVQVFGLSNKGMYISSRSLYASFFDRLNKFIAVINIKISGIRQNKSDNLIAKRQNN